jgi:predicted MPP superfamily phosphohydrolase
MAMLTFMSVALLIYGSMHLYAFGKVWMAFPHSFGLALALTLAGIALTLSPLLVWYMERQSWHSATVATAWVSYTWMGFLFLFLCIGLVFDLGHALATLLHFNWPLNDALAFRTIGLLALAGLGYGSIEARQIRVEKINIATPKLASGRVTFAQISDLHLGMMSGDALLERVIAKLHEIKPDIVVATGDIVDGQGDGLDALARQFQNYTPPLGAYAVTGNHEYYAGLENSLRFLRNAGFTVLRGESAKAGGIVLVGVDESSAVTSGQQAMLDTRKALASVSANDYIVLLKHQPVVDTDTAFDLQLSGHIHGGQIFPFVYLTRLVYGVKTGLTELADGRLLYVNRGAGTWGPPIRLFAPPEITLVTIESASK